MYAKLWEVTEPDTKPIEEVIKLNSDWLGELNDDKYIDINSVYLYFDLDHKDYFTEKDAGRLTEAKVEATLLKDEIFHWLDLYNDFFHDEGKAYFIL